MKSRKKKIMRLILVITVAIFGGCTSALQDTNSFGDPSSYIMRVRPKTRIGNSRPFPLVELPLSTAIGFGKRNYLTNLEPRMKRILRGISTQNNSHQTPIYWLVKLVRKYPGFETE